jgi:hypothetical protein
MGMMREMGSNVLVVGVVYKSNVKWSLCWFSELYVDISAFPVAKMPFTAFTTSFPEQRVLMHASRTVFVRLATGVRTFRSLT